MNVTDGIGLAALTSAELEPSLMSQLSLLRSRLVDPLVGVLHGLAFEDDYYADEPKVPTYRAIVSPTSGFSDGGHSETAVAGGRGRLPDEAEYKALFEGIERYCLSIYRRRDTLYASYLELTRQGRTCIDPALLLGSSGDKGGSGQARLHWVRGWSLVAECETWVPAQSVYLPYRRPAGEPRLRQQVTTGAAAGSTLAAAVYRGLLEVIERDALMLDHYLGLPSRQIPAHSLHDPALQLVLRDVERYGLQVEFFDVQVDIGVWVMVANVYATDVRAPALVTGSKASTSVTDGAMGALLEALTFRRQIRDHWARARAVYRDIVDLGRQIDGLEARAFYWAQLETGGSRLHRRHHRDVVVGEDYADRHPSRWLPEAVWAARDLVYVDTTTPDIAKFGIHVVRVLAPGLQWMHLSEPDMTPSERLLALQRARADFDWQLAPPHPYA